MDTLTRRELLPRDPGRRSRPVILGTGGQQADLLRRLAIFFGRDSAIGRWLMEMFWRW